jgi:hypothetical protein
MRRDHRVYERRPKGLKLGECPFLIPPHEKAITGNIGGQNCSQSPFHSFACQNKLHTPTALKPQKPNQQVRLGKSCKQQPNSHDGRLYSGNFPARQAFFATDRAFGQIRPACRKRLPVVVRP